MRRREFLSAAAGVAASGVAATALNPRPAAAADATAGQLLLELRHYHFASAAKQQAFEQFLADAALPAFHRAGIEPVGVFKLLAQDNPELKLSATPAVPAPAADASHPAPTDLTTDLWVVLPHPSAQSLLTLEATLSADHAFQEAGKTVLAAPKGDPAFLRYESTVLIPFPGFPTLKVPTQAPGRLLQLRTYESHSAERAAKKVAMFNEGGELAIFQRVGMTGVFFGSAVAGVKLPSLTYMLGFDDEAALKKAWDAFRADPDWKKLSTDEGYKDTVSNITNLLLRPTGGSQI